MGLSLILFLINTISAQRGIALTYAPSKVIKHRSDLLFDVPSISHEFRIAYTYQTDGSKSWERYWRKPRVAMNFISVNFGDAEVLGSAVALVPEIHLTGFRYNDFSLNMQFGSGIAYLNKPFDAVENPRNNAIGSNLNNCSSLKFGIEYQINERFQASVSSGIVHFSNGLSSSPNSGINIYGASFWLGYNFISKEEKILIDPIISTRSDEESSYRRWLVDVQYQYGFTERSTPGGPKFGVDVISLGAGYKYSEFITLYAGGEYEYNNGEYVFQKLNFATEEEAQKRAKKTILYLEGETRYGPVFNRMRMGFYVGWPSESSNAFHSKVTTGIYLPRIKNYATPFVGVILKTHIAVADYLAIMGGISF